jgi:hypothetical protein
MTTSFDAALAELYRAPHAEFVATRKRVAAALADDGDVDGAARIVRLARPPVSAWVVNQLWWHARPTFEALIAAAGRLADGDSKAGNLYRDAMTKLRARATALLEAGDHAASETTLRKVTTSLAAIAMAGGFSPDAPGTLSADRQPGDGDHGEVTVTVSARRLAEEEEERRGPAVVRAKPPPPPPRPAPRIANGRVHPHVEINRDDDQQTHVVTERSLLEAALATARTTIDANEREREQLHRRLSEVDQAIRQARTIVADVEARLAAADDRDDS